ncbi:MAG: VWA domain-containing protein, partial [Lysobacteraceae bacterium]
MTTSASLQAFLLQSHLLPHVLRPLWLLGWLALPLLAWWWRARQRRGNPWRRVVDPHLLPSLLDTESDTTTRTPWLMLLTLAVTVFALSGPSWHHEQATLIAPADPLVVAVDLSSAMQAADLPPSRNARLRVKLRQLLAQRRGGQLGLVAYAGAAFTVAPLSDDARSLDDLVDALLPTVMPVDGQRADQAIMRSADLLRQAGFVHGRILLMSDHADAAAIGAAGSTNAR